MQVVSKNAKERRESRTFILPNQIARFSTVRVLFFFLKKKARENAVETKFIICPELSKQYKHRKILLVDDSIVRGTTLKHVVRLIRTHLEPSKLYIASLAPPIISPNVFGIGKPLRF